MGQRGSSWGDVDLRGQGFDAGVGLGDERAVLFHLGGEPADLRGRDGRGWLVVPCDRRRGTPSSSGARRGTKVGFSISRRVGVARSQTSQNPGVAVRSARAGRPSCRAQAAASWRCPKAVGSRPSWVQGAPGGGWRNSRCRSIIGSRRSSARRHVRRPWRVGPGLRWRP